MGWKTPYEFSKAEQVFPATAHEHVPERKEIPKEFWENECPVAHPACKLANTWMYKGLPEGVNLAPVEGIDSEAAYIHINTVLGNRHPDFKNQHKMAAVSFMISRWFVKIWAGDEVLWEAE